MTYYGYTQSERGWHVAPGGVRVDLERGEVQIEAKKGYRTTLSRTYPLLRARVCAKCGAPVVVYAEGSVRELVKATEDADLFSQPWKQHEKAWTLLRERGAFALVAAHGHGEAATEYGSGKCRETEFRLAWPRPPTRAPARRPRPVQGCLF